MKSDKIKSLNNIFMSEIELKLGKTAKIGLKSAGIFPGKGLTEGRKPCMISTVTNL